MSLASRFFRKLLKTLAWVLLLCGLMGLLGKYYWFFDLFSHFVAQYTIIGGFFAFFLLLEGEKKLAFFLFIFAALQAYRLEPLWKTNQEEMVGTNDKLVIMQFNVNKNNPNIEPIVQWVLSPEQQADIVIFFEMTGQWYGAAERLFAKYPYHMMQRIREERQVGIFSTMPLENFHMRRMEDSKALVAFFDIQTKQYHRPVSFFVMHPPPPVSAQAFEQRNDLLTEISYEIAKQRQYNPEKGYIVLVGDLNITRWSSHFGVLQQVARLHDAQDGKGYRSTWPSPLGNKFGIAIDQTLVSRGVIVAERTIGPNLGSDHLPVITTLGIPTLQGR